MATPGPARPLIAAIGAVAANGVIGKDNWLPWDIPEEMAYFERTIAGAVLVIGRLTYASMDVIPGPAFIVTRQPAAALRPGCQACATVEAALAEASALAARLHRDVFVLGGASIYASAWPYCQRFFLTRIEAAFEGDTVLPASIPFADWPIRHEHRAEHLDRLSGKRVRCRYLQYDIPPSAPGPASN